MIEMTKDAFGDWENFLTQAQASTPQTTPSTRPALIFIDKLSTDIKTRQNSDQITLFKHEHNRHSTQLHRRRNFEPSLLSHTVYAALFRDAYSQALRVL